VLARLGPVRKIKGTKRTCRAFRDAAPAIEQDLRRRSGEYEHERVDCVASLPCGRVITISRWFGNAKVWRDGACERTFQPPARSAVLAVLQMPGGARFVSVSNRTMKLWTLDGTLERTFTVGSDVTCVAALPGGAHFVAGLGRGPNFGEVRVYHVDGTLVYASGFKGHNYPVNAVTATPDGQHIISGSRGPSHMSDSFIKVWSVASKSLLSNCAGHADWSPCGDYVGVGAVAAMPDGKRFLSGGCDKTVRVWLLNGTLQNTFELHTDAVTALVALPDNQHALSGSDDNTVKLFNVNNGAVLRTFTHHTSGVSSLALLPDGLSFLSSGDDTARIVEIGPLP
jgi:WD40 repeat protein